jgi:putative transposase
LVFNIGGTPTTARASVAGMSFHVLNRGNRRDPVFHKPGDYDAFVEAMTDACTRARVDLLGYCFKPNHFHLIVRTDRDADLGRWMQRLLMAHARRYYRHYGTTGHVWQGRFKAFPVEDDDHLVTVRRYVERNALRAEKTRTAMLLRRLRAHLSVRDASSNRESCLDFNASRQLCPHAIF